MLRYAGGKTRAVRTLLPYLERQPAVVAPFLGGASVELALARRGVVVHGSDAVAPLINFFAELKADRAGLIARIRKFHRRMDTAMNASA